MEELEDANRRYSAVNDDVTRLMTGIERKFENLPSVGRDQRAVQQQLTQVQVRQTQTALFVSESESST